MSTLICPFQILHVSLFNCPCSISTVCHRCLIKTETMPLFLYILHDTCESRILEVKIVYLGGIKFELLLILLKKHNSSVRSKKGDDEKEVCMGTSIYYNPQFKIIAKIFLTPQKFPIIHSFSCSF